MADPPRDDKATRPPGRRREASTPPPAEAPRRYVPPTPGAAAPRDLTPAQPIPRGRLALDADPLRGAPLGQRERGRVTINFSGPPLELPGAPAMPPAAPLPRPTRSSVPVAMPGGDAEEHDAWVTERKRRSTLPPIAGLPLSATGTLRPSAAPVSPLQHRWVSSHQAPLRPAALPIELPELDGGALTLVDRSRPSEPALDLMAEVRARYALDDLTGALQMAELVLGADAQNAEAKQFASTCRMRLEALYTSQVGPLSAVPRVDVPDTDIRWLGLDHRAGFLLSRVDGFTSLEELLDLSGMPRLEALKTVLSLVDAGAIMIPR